MPTSQPVIECWAHFLAKDRGKEVIFSKVIEELKKERDWSVSYTISWGGVNQCPKLREQALLLICHILQLIAAAIENEGLPFICSYADEAPSFNLSFLCPLQFQFIYSFYLFVVFINIFLYCCFYFLSFSFLHFTPQFCCFILLLFDQNNALVLVFSEAGQLGWSWYFV